ncbi:MAG: hypothetical protein V4672_18780 [Verrucomicrobiota bacterium]
MNPQRHLPALLRPLFLALCLSLPAIQAQETTVTLLSAAERDELWRVNQITPPAMPLAAPGSAPQLPERVLCLSQKNADGSARLVWRDYKKKAIVSQFFGSDKLLKSETVRQTGPAPLTQVERTVALYLSKDQSAELKALYGPDLASAQPFQEMLPIVTDQADARFAHRLVRFRFQKKRDPGPLADHVLIVVDLDERKVIESTRSEGAWEETPTLATPEAQAAIMAPGQVPQGAPRQTATVLQKFTLNFWKTPTTPVPSTTAWRVTFGIESHNGGSKIMFIEKADYSRDYKDDADANNDGWITILGDTRLAEINVPYNKGGPEYYDISDFSFGLHKLNKDSDGGPTCIGPKEVFFDCVLKELHDAQNYSLDKGGRTVRGQQMDLWSALSAANYSYIMRYTFHADGMIEMNLGPAAHNLTFPGTQQTQDISTHLHIGCWRITPVLGDARNVAVKEIKYISTSTTGSAATTQVADFNGGREGGIELRPQEYTMIRLESRTQKNTHQPPSPLSYDVITRTHGTARRYVDGASWSLKDFWVTLRQTAAGEPALDFRNLPDLAAARRSLTNAPIVLWHHASLIHRARDEDFGPVGTDPNAGIASTGYVGLMLKPRNLHPSSPFYKP